jgi:hypothetical protein
LLLGFFCWVNQPNDTFPKQQISNRTSNERNTELEVNEEQSIKDLAIAAEENNEKKTNYSPTNEEQIFNSLTTAGKLNYLQAVKQRFFANCQLVKAGNRYCHYHSCEHKVIINDIHDNGKGLHQRSCSQIKVRIDGFYQDYCY